MYNNSALGIKCPLFSFLVLTMSAMASSSVPVSLPPVAHADTETTTNVVFAAGIPYSGKFALSLECLATPSNNVQAAFGTDANANGVLDLEETELFNANGAPLFADVAAAHPNWLYSRSWNMLRLTGRGLDASGESFSVQIQPDGFTIILR